MDQAEKKGKNKIVILAIAATVLIAAGVVLFLLLGRETSYRLLKIFEVDGKANVVRSSIGDIEPYANMVLESGDRVSLDTGKLTIQADKDKYIYFEEHTEIVLNAEGDSKNSKTTIELRSGAITNDIQNKLTDGASYEINTPNSTMSVRGTIFFVWIYEIDGVKYTRVCVFDGVVATRLVYKDGSIAQEEVLVSKGKEVIIYEDDTTTNYLFEPRDIDYDSLPESVLKLLLTFNDNGRDLTITNPEIRIILEGPYTVTFTYEGEVFGTQTVKKGEKVIRPTLQPAESGDWDYDFDEPVERNIEIKWK